MRNKTKTEAPLPLPLFFPGPNSLIFRWFFCLLLQKALHGMGKGSCSQSSSSTSSLTLVSAMTFLSWPFFSLFSLTAAAQLFCPLLNMLSQWHPRSQLGPARCSHSLSSPWPPLRTGCGLGETNCTETHKRIVNIGFAVTLN